MQEPSAASSQSPVSPSGRAPAGSARGGVKLIAVLVIAVALFVLVIVHARGINGPWYWKWSWRQLDGGAVYPLFLLAGIPFFLGQYLYARRRWPPVPALLLLLMVSMLLAELGAMSAQNDEGLGHITRIVRSPVATSYYSDALAFHQLGQQMSLRARMTAFPDLMRVFYLHSRTKPPGPVLYYTAAIAWLGEEDAAFVGGMLLGVLALLSIPATYLLMRALGCQVDAAFNGASFMALCPALVLIFRRSIRPIPSSPARWWGCGG